MLVVFFCCFSFSKQYLQGISQTEKKTFLIYKIMYFFLFVIIILLPFWNFRIDGTKLFLNILCTQQNLPLFSITSIILFNLKQKKIIIIIKVSVKENIYTWIFRQENIPNNISRLKKFHKTIFFLCLGMPNSFCKWQKWNRNFRLDDLNSIFIS